MARDEQIPKTDAAEIERVIERLRESNLEKKDQELVERLLRTVLTLVRVLQEKNISLKRLKRMIFGPGTDKRAGNRPWSRTEEEKTDSKEATGGETKTPQASSSKPKRSGHGRMGSSAYRGAEVVKCRHSNLRPSDSCPDPYCGGRLYDTKEPAIFIQLRGQPLVGATRYEQEVLRCTVCQDRYTASLPVEVKSGKYDASCDVTIAVAKYGAGIPWHRLKRMQEAFGVPLPESVQFERCEAVADTVLPVYLYLRKLAANGEVLYSDDTRVRILSCMKENEEREEERRGTQTTGIVIEAGGRKIALYANGRRHSGENLDELLKKRDQRLGRPIQMSDALAANWSGEEETIEAKCMAHARRKFVEIEPTFPEECAVALEAIAKVYGVEAETEGMSPRERLEHHQSRSGPVMKQLHEWMEEQFAERKVEPNSSLGQAIRYTLKHWEGLTCFLREERAPLDNNPAERALKPAVLLRKNALFYRNEHGAMVGAILMSLIETSRLNGASPWKYLLALMRNKAEVRQNPGEWLPWDYDEAERNVA